ncbi:hypothetical protein [Roseomonas fluvialis]|uniref:Uncharacterized protein n=1 Tax=Roseomonas fluvialis TaxID=1750527 RepID=A0ABM7YB01_9PROT|nr:hypothetical protein [Roseomonas fluvialis]BDG75200.1 hypothetical protein Rmf_51290 [Roseomonas fluvialis]
MIRILLGIMLGLVLGWVGTAAAVLLYGELARVSQAEGAFAMGAIFVAGPAGAVAGAVLGGVLGASWNRHVHRRMPQSDGPA